MYATAICQNSCFCFLSLYNTHRDRNRYIIYFKHFFPNAYRRVLLDFGGVGVEVCSLEVAFFLPNRLQTFATIRNEDHCCKVVPLACHHVCESGLV